MAGVAVRESLTFSGRADQVREARAFVARVLGPAHPCLDVAILLASEVTADSVRHSRTAALGEAITVTVALEASRVRVVVTDRAVDGVPVLRPAGEEAEGSRGLRLVDDLAVRWGYERSGGRATTWFELERGWPPPAYGAGGNFQAERSTD